MYEYGAALVYLCLFKNTEIIPTIQMNDFLEIDQEVQEALVRGLDLPEVAYGKREQLALTEVKSYLETNKGSRVFLIFGYKHKFEQHLNENFNPTLLVCRD